MLRFAFALCFVAAPLAAQDKAELCDISGSIVDAAVVARTDGATERKARKTVIRSLPDEQANFKPTVEPIVQWVYTLPEGQLGDGVATAYVEACLAQ